MENTLHRQLKELYVAEADDREVAVDGFRIDAIVDDTLVEIQCSPLLAIRDKVRQLLESHVVLVVKPLAARKYLITRQRKRGKVVSRRYSPARCSSLNLFEELVHFVDVFPHPNLTLELLLVEVEEHRIKRKPRRWRGKDHRVEDRRLRSVGERHEFRTVEDLLSLLPPGLPAEFTTADIADRAECPRWLAQKMAYCLRRIGALETVDQRGRLRVYRIDADLEQRNKGKAA